MTENVTHKYCCQGLTRATSVSKFLQWLSKWLAYIMFHEMKKKKTRGAITETRTGAFWKQNTSEKKVMRCLKIAHSVERLFCFKHGAKALGQLSPHKSMPLCFARKADSKGWPRDNPRRFDRWTTNIILISGFELFRKRLQCLWCNKQLHNNCIFSFVSSKKCYVAMKTDSAV